MKRATADNAWSALAAMYAQPGMKEALLALQEDAGVSVSALLTLIWSSAVGYGAATDKTVREIVADTEALEAEVLRPYRRARNGLRAWAAKEGEAANLRRQLLEQELVLERYVLRRVLERLAAASAREPAGDAAVDVERVVARYLEQRGVPWGRVPEGMLERLREAAVGSGQSVQ